MITMDNLELTIGTSFPEDNSDGHCTVRKTSERHKFLYIDAKGVKARGYEEGDGFVICKGSQAVVEEASSLETHYGHVVRARKLLIDQGILKKDAERNVFIFTQDHALNSANYAGNIVLAVSREVLNDWKDEHGTPLKEIRQREAESASVLY